MKKSEIVKGVYRAILNAIDSKEIDSEGRYSWSETTLFTNTRKKAIEDFASTWFVEEDELHTSAIQYVIGMDPIPNIGG